MQNLLKDDVIYYFSLEKNKFMEELVKVQLKTFLRSALNDDNLNFLMQFYIKICKSDRLN